LFWFTKRKEVVRRNKACKGGVTEKERAGVFKFLGGDGGWGRGQWDQY